MDTCRIKSQCLQEFPKEYPSPSSVEISAGVVAISRMATTDENCVGSIFEGFHNKIEVNSSRAGQADDSHVGRIDQSARTGKVGTEIGTPVANKGNDFWFKSILILHAPILADAAENVKSIFFLVNLLQSGR